MEKSALNAEIRNDNANGKAKNSTENASKRKRIDPVAAAIVTFALAVVAVCWGWSAWETAREKAIFERARLEAEVGDPVGMWKLGYCYNNGIGVAKSGYRAFEWWRKGADLNDAWATCCVGLCYDLGWGVAVDQKAAFDWYLKAAELGDAEATATVGGRYLTGNGVEKDVEKGLEWTRKAFDLDAPTAARNLACCYRTGYGVAFDWAKDEEYARQARKLQERLNAEVKRRLETPRPLPGEQASE